MNSPFAFVGSKIKGRCGGRRDILRFTSALLPEPSLASVPQHSLCPSIEQPPSVCDC
jgi:hypothetical protein